LLSGGLHETNTVVSSGNIVFLVEENEVDRGPDGDEGDANDCEEAACPEFANVAFFLGEEDDSERRSDNQACSENDSDKNVPPVDIVVQELVKDLEEDEKGNGNDCGANEEDSAPDWEEAAASEILGLLGSALA